MVDLWSKMSYNKNKGSGNICQSVSVVFRFYDFCQYKGNYFVEIPWYLKNSAAVKEKYRWILEEWQSSCRIIRNRLSLQPVHFNVRWNQNRKKMK